MSYETIKIESKDADRVHVLTGTIVSTGDGVAEVNIDDYGIYSDVPVFYHCPESETADGMPFTKDDRVIIVNSGNAIALSVSEMKVVGYEDGLPRMCIWEPWNTDLDDPYKFDTTNPWEVIYTYPSGRQPFSMVNGFLEYDANNYSGVNDGMECFDGGNLNVPIPKKEIYFNIASTISGAGPTVWAYAYLVLFDNNNKRCFLIFSDSHPDRVWSRSIKIGDNDGKTPIDLSPHLTGEYIKYLVFETGYDPGASGTFRSDFISFR